MDLNECDPPGLCSQHCVNTKGSYFCSCAPGYVLESDKHTCKALSKTKLCLFEIIITYFGCVNFANNNFYFVIFFRSQCSVFNNFQSPFYIGG